MVHFSFWVFINVCTPILPYFGNKFNSNFQNLPFFDELHNKGLPAPLKINKRKLPSQGGKEINVVNQYEISELEKEKNALEQQLEALRKKFDNLRQEQGNYSYYGRTFSQLCELESQLEKVNQELDEKYAERAECDNFVKKHSNTFCKFKENYINEIAYFKKSVHLSNMLFIMFSFAFGIGLLASIWAWIEDESIVASLICIALMTTLCVVAYIVCKKYIDKYCTHLAKEDSDIDIQRTVNRLIQQDTCQELKNALLEAGLSEEYKKIKKKYDQISQNIGYNDDFRAYCNFPTSD